MALTFLAGLVCILPISNLSTSDFKFAKSTTLANFNVLTPVMFLSQICCRIRQI